MVEVHMNARSPVLIVWSFIMLLIGVVAVGLRILSMRTRRRELKIHDYLVFIALVSRDPKSKPRWLTMNPADVDWVCGGHGGW